MCRSRDDVDGVHVDVETDVVVVAHDYDVHPEGEPRHVGGPAGLPSCHQSASPVRVTTETILEQVQLRLGSYHQQVSLGMEGEKGCRTMTNSMPLALPCQRGC